MAPAIGVRDRGRPGMQRAHVRGRAAPAPPRWAVPRPRTRSPPRSPHRARGDGSYARPHGRTGTERAGGPATQPLTFSPHAFESGLIARCGPMAMRPELDAESWADRRVGVPALLEDKYVRRPVQAYRQRSVPQRRRQSAERPGARSAKRPMVPQRLAIASWRPACGRPFHVKRGRWTGGGTRPDASHRRSANFPAAVDAPSFRARG
jgi:hypothetical protein